LKSPQIFLSYASQDTFEAVLLAEALEAMLSDLGAKVWVFGRDQSKKERDIGVSLKERIGESRALVILISGFTIGPGKTQWMELAYADAFSIPAFILLHHMTYDDLRRAESVPPLATGGHCTLATEWRTLENELRECCAKK
jgi:hypothetical protein